MRAFSLCWSFYFLLASLDVRVGNQQTDYVFRKKLLVTWCFITCFRDLSSIPLVSDTVVIIGCEDLSRYLSSMKLVGIATERSLQMYVSLKYRPFLKFINFQLV